MSDYFLTIACVFRTCCTKEKENKLYFKTQKNPNRKTQIKCSCWGDVSKTKWGGREGCGGGSGDEVLYFPGGSPQLGLWGR